MKTRVTALLLSLCLLIPIFSLEAGAADGDANVIQTVQALGILAGDANGNLNLGGNITRAQFAKMLVAASSYKDSVSEEGAGYSLFKDVKSGHWASEYIRLAVQEGWMVGYTDGTFRPDKSVTLEEACTAVLSLLGYDSSTLAGSFPSAQLSKASALGLRDGITVGQGGAMTRRDGMYLFYHALTAKNADGQVYGTTLGYTITNGQVDYSAVVEEGLSGPYVSEGGSVSLPFDSADAVVYRDGKESSLSAISRNDVYYYNTGMRTVWCYTDQVTGTVTEIDPSTVAPTSVTVAGQTYPLGTSEASYQVSQLGEVTKGDVVTLLLGMDGSVARVLTGSQVGAVYYGVIISSNKTTSTDGTAIQNQVVVACTDGVERTYYGAKEKTYSVGNLATVSLSDGGSTVQTLSETSLSGTFNASTKKFGDKMIADDIEILDTSSTGDYIKINASRMSGCQLDRSDVRYYTLNEEGEIDRLILDDCTGDTWSYGYMISAKSSGVSDASISGQYTYIMDGTTTTMNTTNLAYSVKSGGLALRKNGDGSLKTMRNLTSVNLTSLSSLTAMAGNQKYTVAENAQVYLKQDSSYVLTTLSAVNGEEYSLTGWYDDFSCSAGGQIRVIIAVKR